MEALRHEHAAVAVRILCLLLTLCPVALLSQTVRPTADALLSRVESAWEGIEDYKAELRVTVDFERLKVPAMQVRLYYKKPDKVHFESEGFAMLPRDGVAFHPSAVRKKFDVEGAAVVKDDSAGRWLLTLLPRDFRASARRVFLSVDAARWTVERIESHLGDGRTMVAVFRHEQQSGFWLPASVLVTFSEPSAGTDEPALPGSAGSFQRSSLPRTGTISVTYSRYVINPGLPDELFEQRNAVPPRE